jgi:hypothetical protein
LFLVRFPIKILHNLDQTHLFYILFNEGHQTRPTPMVILGGLYSSIVIMYRNVRVQINVLLLFVVKKETSNTTTKIISEGKKIAEKLGLDPPDLS